MHRLWSGLVWAVLFSVMAAAWLPGRALAQDQGIAIITSPLDGAAATGEVVITGSATHGQFQRYELAFAYSVNPTDTWFPIQPASTSQVANDMLGRWDTRQISDGVYTLRLRVYWAEGAFLEALVHGVQVQNATATPPQGTSLAPAASTAEPTPAAPTQAVIALPPTATPRPTAGPADPGSGGPGAEGPGPGTGDGGATPRVNAGLIGEAFVAGIRLTVVSFLILAAYVSVRAMLRARPRR